MLYAVCELWVVRMCRPRLGAIESLLWRELDDGDAVDFAEDLHPVGVCIMLIVERSEEVVRL